MKLNKIKFPRRLRREVSPGKGDRMVEAFEHCVQNFHVGNGRRRGGRREGGGNSWGNSVFDTSCALKAAMLPASHKRNTG